MKKIKLNENVLVSGGLIILGVAQMLLSNKKEAAAINSLEEKVTEKVMKNLSKNDQRERTASFSFYIHYLFKKGESK